MLLVSCSKGNSERIAGGGCGILFEYSHNFQQRAAKQAETLRKRKTFKEVSVLLDDYADTRQSIRECNNVEVDN